ncbi:MAG: PAS domain S-box protein [Spirochaetales bacterium]|nr:PAS domain S-box protein [Spirochaetales bacterium]
MEKNFLSGQTSSEKESKQKKKLMRTGYYLFDVGTGTWCGSEAVDRIFGIETGYGRTVEGWLDIVHPDHKKMMRDYLLDHVINGKNRFDKQYKIINVKTKQIHLVHGRGDLRLDNDGNVTHVFGIVEDMSENENTGLDFLESEERNKIISEITTDYTFVVAVNDDGTMEIQWVSDSFVKLTGRDVTEVKTSKMWKHVIDEDDWDKFNDFIKKVLAEKKAGELECRSVRGKKGKSWIHIYVYPKTNENGRLFIIGAVKDISERKEAEIMLAAEHERLLVTLQSIGDGVIATDTKGGVVIMNRIAEDLTGWSQEEAEGRPLSEVFVLINEITRQPCENPVDKVLATKQIVELANHTVLLSKNRNKPEIIIADSGAPIFDKEKNIIGVVLVFRDITEKQRLLEEAQKAQKLESLGILAGGIAHDFNNLLGGIYGNIELAAMNSRNTSVKKFLEHTVKTINRAKNLTGQLLTFSKGGIPIKKTEPLAPFIKDTVKFVLSGSNIECKFVFDDDCAYCRFDKNQIGQVIDNIVINAIQAMPDGGTIDVSVSNTIIHEKEYPNLGPGKYVKISIRDRGRGIPKDILPYIFDPFFTTKQKGSGLGLATSYSIVSNHGGVIEVESEEGTGTICHVILPAFDEDDTMEADDRKPGLMKGKGKILFMDDEQVIRESIGEILKMLGYSYLTAKDGKEALAVFNDEKENGAPFSAVILDLTVRGAMGGKETAREIRKTDRDVPIFVSSGYADDPVIAHPSEYGFTDSIIKPFSVSELANLLERNSKR